ncbi:MAG: hypothetical protein QF570_06465 [Myxococcota bacterium]|jgi:hypothetical protein|nr:hypothetical protein [Myxococcota bacterium]
MGAQLQTPVRGRLANVSAVVFAAGGTREEAGREAARLLGTLFEEVSWVGPGDPLEGTRRIATADDAAELSRLHAALTAANEDRVLVWDPVIQASPPLLLGLCAWPEHAVVTPRIEGVEQPLCAVYLRSKALETAADLIARGEVDAAALVRELSSGVIEGDDLAPLLAR